MSTAAKVAGWNRRWKRGVALATPQGHDVYRGDANQGPIGLTVELQLGALGWTDITAYVYYRDSSSKITITRGKPNETATIQPQSAALELKNGDGRFSPRNPNGPYYGYLTRNTPLRISRMQNGVRRYRFHGEVPDWPTNADTTLTDVYIRITAYGQLRRLQQGTAPVLSAMYRAYTKTTLIPATVAYWPCEDTPGATVIGSATPGGSPMSFVGKPTFASNSAFACSQALPALAASQWNGAVTPGLPWTDNVVRFLFQIPSGGDANGAAIVRFYTTGDVARMEMFYTTASGGSLGYRGYNAAGVQLWTTTIGIDAATGLGYNGELVRGSIALRQQGTGVEYEFGSLTVGAGAPVGTGATLASSSVGAVTTVQINPDGLLTGTAIGHISVQSVWDDLQDVVNPINAWNFDGAVGRLQRIWQEEGVNQATVGAFDLTQEASLMGNQSPDTFLNIVAQCVAVDGGLMFEARDQLAVAYRPVANLYNQGTKYQPVGSVFALDFAANQLSALPVPQDDDYYTKNDVTVRQSAGTSARAVLSAGALSTGAPPAGVGPYPTSFTLNTGPDNFFFGQTSTGDYAGWRLHLGTVDDPRYPTISVNLRAPEVGNQLTVLNAALVADIGDVLTIANPPAWLPPYQVRQIVQGYTETLGTFEHDIVFNCSPEAPYRVMQLDDPVLSVSDTDGSTLAATYPLGTETTLLVATTGAQPGSPLWTTTGGAFPFDVQVGGERITVTGITGVSSPQTFTVTRSVNGVVKPQTAGTDVRLYQPAILSIN